MKFNDMLMTQVDADIQKGIIPMLLGEPGIGKSSWVQALGQRNGTQVFVLACNQLADKADLTGARLVPIPGTEEYKQVFYPHSTIMDAIMYADEHPRENPILFMDELNRTTPDVTSACLSVPTLRKIGDKCLPDNLRVITAGNDKGNITSLDEASVSRFHLYNVAPDVDTYIGISPSINPFVKQVLLDHPETIFCKKLRVAASGNDDDDDMEVDINAIVDDAEEMNQITTPRTITAASDWLNAFSNQQLVEMLTDITKIDGEDVSALQESLEGLTGKTNFTAFLLAEIASKVSTVNNQSNVLTIQKPQCYDAMKRCSDVTALNQFIANMNEAEKSAVLVYMLQERVDNSRYISVLAPSMTQLLGPDIRNISSLFVSNQLDEGNVDALSNCRCNVRDQVAIFLN